MSLREDEPPEGGSPVGWLLLNDLLPGEKQAGQEVTCAGLGRVSLCGVLCARGAGQKAPGRVVLLRPAAPPPAPPHGAHTGSWRHGGLGRQHTSKWELRSWQGRRAHVGSHPRLPVAQRATRWACPRVCLGTTHVCTRRTACASLNDTR